MNNNVDKDELKAEIERGHFARAASLSASLCLPEKEIKEFRVKALWQMSAVYRNAPGTKNLALQYGLSKSEVRQVLEQVAAEQGNAKIDKALEPCYDHSTGKYLTFEEWMNHFLKNWDKFSGPQSKVSKILQLIEIVLVLLVLFNASDLEWWNVGIMEGWV